MSLKRACIQTVILTIWCLSCSTSPTRLLGPQDVNNLPAAPADHRISYGSDPLQFADLRLPKGEGPFPVAVIIHGGCWISNFADLQNTAPLSDALRRSGLATWNIEYRRVDNTGGGWPGTFNDVATAIDHLKTIAETYKLDLNRVIAIGHSAGGHLALWAAARHRLPKTSPLFAENPLRLRGAVNLGGPGNLQSFFPTQRLVCGDSPITRLLGGSPGEVPQRYRDASPSELLPLGVRQILITGAKDSVVPPDYGRQYEAEARKSGDEIEMIVIDNAGHFEVIAPNSTAWSAVERAVLSLTDEKR
ncbi:MAG: alpha/beta hydrolase [Acidobacteriota bacterium]